MACVLSDLNLKEAQVVAVLMQNSVEFLIVFLAIVKIGCIPALLNYNVKSEALVELIRNCDPCLVVHDAEYADLVCGLNVSCVSATEILNEESTLQLLPKLSANALDAFCYIFTSGTTGLAKAVKVTHAKAHAAAAIASAFGQALA